MNQHNRHEKKTRSELRGHPKYIRETSSFKSNLDSNSFLGWLTNTEAYLIGMTWWTTNAIW